MELSEYRGIKFNLNLNRYGTGNPEKFYAIFRVLTDFPLHLFLL